MKKDHLCSACERGKSKKASHPSNLVSSDNSKLELLHMDLCGPMRNQDISTKSYVELYTYLKAYEPHALKTLKKQEQSSSSVDPLAYLAHSSKHQTSTTVASPTSTSSSTLAPEQQAQLGSDAMMATMQQLVKLLSGFQKQFPPTNNQLRTSSNPRSHAMVHEGQIVTTTVQRKAPGNVSNAGHVARNFKEPKRAKDTQYYKDKMMLSDAKDRGVILDAEAKTFLADVECTEPYDESLALTTTTTFHVSHEDAYDSDIDDGPYVADAFMVNLSSTEEANGTSSSKINEVHSNAFDLYNSDTDDNTMTYQQYLLLTKAVVPLTEKPSETHYVSPGEMYLQDQITAIIPQLEGHIKTNKDLS
nr:integrase, catalytic region, zinc finger, CCHC-type, peptidase aspartic, catalytic [Tanacetum cinerariifolium]